MIPAHKKLVDRIHEIGGKIVLQIAHCGRQTWSSETGEPLYAPSAIPCGFYREMPKEMSEEDRPLGRFVGKPVQDCRRGVNGRPGEL